MEDIKELKQFNNTESDEELLAEANATSTVKISTAAIVDIYFYDGPSPSKAADFTRLYASSGTTTTYTQSISYRRVNIYPASIPTGYKSVTVKLAGKELTFTASGYDNRQVLQIGSSYYSTTQLITVTGEKQTYTITYDARGGTASKTSDTGTYKSTVAIPTWGRDTSSETNTDAWTFDANGGIFSGTTTTKKVSTSSTTTTSYTFTRWIDGDGYEYQQEDAYTIYGDDTVSAYYNSNSSTVFATITAPGAPTRTGYTFKGWGDGTTVSWAAGAIITPTTLTATIYAVWQVNTYTITVTASAGGKVQYSAEGSEAAASISFTMPYGAYYDSSTSVTNPLVFHYRSVVAGGVTAIPDAGYYLSAWTPNSTTITADQSITATFTKYSWTTSAGDYITSVSPVSGSGVGNITATAYSSGYGSWYDYNFGTTLFPKYIEKSDYNSYSTPTWTATGGSINPTTGTTTTFTPTADSGVVTASSTKTITKSKYKFSLVYDANGGTGTMSPSYSSEVEGSQPASGVITVKSCTYTHADTSAGYKVKFSSWNTNKLGLGTVIPVGDYTFTENTTIYAQWATADIYVKISCSDGSTAGTGGTVTPESGYYAVGDSINLTATPATNYTFDHWIHIYWVGDTSSGSYVTEEITTQNPTVTVITANKQEFFEAVFTYNYVTVTPGVAAGYNHGTVSPSSAFEVHKGSVISFNGNKIVFTYGSETKSITATPESSGYYLAGWYNGWGTKYAAGDTITSNATVNARFSSKTYISVTANPTAGGTVTGEGYYAPTDSVTIKATANSGYTFTEWQYYYINPSTSEGSWITYTTESTKTFIASECPGGQNALQAVFMADIAITAESTNTKYGSVTVASFTVPYGSVIYPSGVYIKNSSGTVLVEAVPKNEMFDFSSWSFSGELTVKSAQKIKATFTKKTISTDFAWTYAKDSSGNWVDNDSETILRGELFSDQDTEYDPPQVGITAVQWNELVSRIKKCTLVVGAVWDGEPATAVRTEIVTAQMFNDLIDRLNKAIDADSTVQTKFLATTYIESKVYQQRVVLPTTSTGDSYVHATQFSGYTYDQDDTGTYIWTRNSLKNTLNRLADMINNYYK